MAVKKVLNPLSAIPHENNNLALQGEVVDSLVGKNSRRGN
jgi:hypothetical protein